MPDHLTPAAERELAALDDALAGRPVAPDLHDLGELALLLRDERIPPSDAFGRHLDTRAERGFPGRDPRTRASRRRGLGGRGAWLGPALAATTTVLLIAVVLVSAPGGRDEEASSGGAGAVSADGGGGQESGGAGASTAQDDGAGGLSEPLPPSVAPVPGPGSPRSDGRDRRKVERSASLTLAARPRDIDGVSARVQEVTRQQGGFVASSTVSSSAGGGGGTFELRVPARNLDPAMAALARLGHVRERAQRSQDITAQAVSARRELADARTERKSLLSQLANAVSAQETEAISARLDIVSREIERARAGVRRVGNRAAFATVAVTLVADLSAGGAAEDDGAWTPGDAARDALRVLEVAAGVALIALALGLPLALLAFMAALALRRTRRRRRDHALDAV